MRAVGRRGAMPAGSRRASCSALQPRRTSLAELLQVGARPLVGRERRRSDLRDAQPVLALLDDLAVARTLAASLAQRVARRAGHEQQVPLGGHGGILVLALGCVPGEDDPDCAAAVGPGADGHPAVQSAGALLDRLEAAAAALARAVV